MCPSGEYLCPENLAGAGACCKSGLACGKGYCYATSYPMVVLTQTSVYRDDDKSFRTTVAVITTAFQPSTVPTIATTAAPTRIVVTETAIAKIAAVDTQPRSGMSKGTMNGIIAGAVIALVLILLGAWLIIRRLNFLARRSRELEVFAATAGSGSGHHKHNLSGDSGVSGSGRGEMTTVRNSHGHRPDHISHSNMSIDPLFNVSGSTTPRLPRPSFSHNTSTDTDIYGYGTSQSQSPPPIPAPYVWNQGYNPISNNEGSYFFQSQSKHASIDSAGGVGTLLPAYNGNASEVSRESFLRNQNLWLGRDSQRQSLQSTHGRQWSDVSDMSHASNSSGGNALSELDGRRVSVGSPLGSPDSEPAICPRSGIDRRPSGERRTRSWTFMNVGGRGRRGSSGFALNTLVGGPSTPLSGGGRLEGVQEAENDATHGTGLLGKAKKKEGRPRASTKGSDVSTVVYRGPQSRSNSEGQIPQIMYTHQAENHSLPRIPDSPPVGRAAPHLAGPLSPRSTVHPPLEWSRNDILVTTSTETTSDSIQNIQTEGTRDTQNGTDKKEVLVQTSEVDPRDP